jgi:hypothetical protein
MPKYVYNVDRARNILRMDNRAKQTHSRFHGISGYVNASRHVICRPPIVSTFQFVCAGEIESRTLLTGQIQAFTAIVLMLHNISRCLYRAL